MGKQERWEARRKMEGKQLWSKSFRLSDLLDVFLYPYRAWKEKARQEALRQSIIKDMVSSEDATDAWTYTPVPEEQLGETSNPKEQAWIEEILKEEKKGE